MKRSGGLFGGLPSPIDKKKPIQQQRPAGKWPAGKQQAPPPNVNVHSNANRQQQASMQRMVDVESRIRGTEIFRCGFQIDDADDRAKDQAKYLKEVVKHYKMILRMTQQEQVPQVVMPLRCMVWAGDRLKARTWLNMGSVRPHRGVDLVTKWREEYPGAYTNPWLQFGQHFSAFCSHVREGDILVLTPAEYSQLGLSQPHMVVCVDEYVCVDGRYFTPSDYGGCRGRCFQVDAREDCVVCQICGVSAPLRQTRELYVTRRATRDAPVAPLRGEPDHFLSRLVSWCFPPPFSLTGGDAGVRGFPEGVEADALRLFLRVRAEHFARPCKDRRADAGDDNFYIGWQENSKLVGAACVATLLYVLPEAMWPRDGPRLLPRDGGQYIGVEELIERDFRVAQQCPRELRAYFLECVYDPRRPAEDARSWMRWTFECARCKRVFTTRKAMQYAWYHRECTSLVHFMVERDDFYSREAEMQYRAFIMGPDFLKRLRNERYFDAVVAAQSRPQLTRALATIDRDMRERERNRPPDMFLRTLEADWRDWQKYRPGGPGVLAAQADFESRLGG